MKALLGTVAAIAALALMVGGLYYGGVISNRVHANYNARVVTSKLKQQVNTASFMRESYDHFYNLCAAIQGDEVALDAQRYALRSATTDDDKARINANIAGITADRGGAIAEYNADAHKTFTLGTFRAADLPFTINLAGYRKGAHTQCGV